MATAASASSSAHAAQMDLGRHFYLNKVLEQYAAKPATRMTLRQLVFFGRTLGRDRDKILKVSVCGGAKITYDAHCFLLSDRRAPITSDKNLLCA
jgi:hypothetical protein